MNLQMLNDHAYVTVESDEQESASGIIVQTASNNVTYGVVYAVDADNDYGLKVGDRVMFNAPMAMEVKLPDGTVVKDIILDSISAIINV
jgi:co-chaperonin GroES (HSP10)